MVLASTLYAGSLVCGSDDCKYWLLRSQDLPFWRLRWQGQNERAVHPRHRRGSWWLGRLLVVYGNPKRNPRKPHEKAVKASTRPFSPLLHEPSWLTFQRTLTATLNPWTQLTFCVGEAKWVRPTWPTESPHTPPGRQRHSASLIGPGWRGRG